MTSKSSQAVTHGLDHNGLPVYPGLWVRYGSIIGKVVTVTEPLSPHNRSVPGRMDLLVAISPVEPGIGGQACWLSSLTERVACECDWADDAGDPEVGPDPYISELNPQCPLHGVHGADIDANGRTPWAVMCMYEQMYERSVEAHR